MSDVEESRRYSKHRYYCLGGETILVLLDADGLIWKAAPMVPVDHHGRLEGAEVWTAVAGTGPGYPLNPLPARSPHA